MPDARDADDRARAFNAFLDIKGYRLADKATSGTAVIGVPWWVS